MSKEKIYIAYGSNLNLPQMSMRCPDAKILGTSEIEDYELVFRGSKTGSYATIEPCEGATVPVLLWSITPHDEKMLDVYEGYPSFYEKENMTLPLDGNEVTAMVYIMPSHHVLGMPSQRYIDTIVEGYETADFDVDILYLQRAGSQGNSYAHYRLGKLYLSGEDVPKDTSKAVEHFTASADAGHTYAQYTLGKLYLMGKDVEQDREQAYQWFQKSAEQGNQYAQFFVDNPDKFQSPSALISATRLLHHASRVFEDRSPLRTPVGLHIDRKRRLVLSKKKQSQGHKRDDYAPELSMYRKIFA